MNTGHEPDEDQSPPQKKDYKPRIGKYSRRYAELAKYSGMAIQFALLIAIAAWLGQKLDAHFTTAKPYWTAGLVVFFAVGYFIRLYKDITS